MFAKLPFYKLLKKNWSSCISTFDTQKVVLPNLAPETFVSKNASLKAQFSDCCIRMGVAEEPVRDPENQSYFSSNTKALLSLFILIHSQIRGGIVQRLQVCQ